MMVSSKGRYALRVMIYLAQNDREELIPLKEIAENQNISMKYLEMIVSLVFIFLYFSEETNGITVVV